MTTKISTLEELKALEGQEVGVSEWMTITQEQVNLFAEATGDHQWIHVDEERAKASQFGGTIAHGFLTLSLIPVFGSQIFDLDMGQAKLNYGCEKVRFTNPVLVGSKIRARATFDSVKEIDKGVQVVTTYTVEIEGVERPALVAQQITLVIG
ncbi:MaoC family dehydratase [Marihabitans asiaticum]|uniref:Acyl dehydratase n=1 Tax=Marihabitans asiaticum TaxID=415218 RepID=A0A560WGQ3_9MICO|nr:MaoC family dehydratase [Marihabitans asiaticum]TWD16674.1 acyl dehydratase [Marihabitans asiaticum]